MVLSLYVFVDRCSINQLTNYVMSYSYKILENDLFVIILAYIQKWDVMSFQLMVILILSMLKLHIKNLNRLSDNT